LRSAVQSIERARTTLRGDVRAALGLWRGLVSARWSLVDAFEADGARYIVARENIPDARLSGLTPTESCVVTYAARGFSTKEIAYTLGVSDATVRVLIRRAVQRCGVRDRHELFSLASSQCNDDGG
jgi:DNA-binding NarL/FixJ family response regulator